MKVDIECPGGTGYANFLDDIGTQLRRMVKEDLLKEAREHLDRVREEKRPVLTVEPERGERLTVEVGPTGRCLFTLARDDRGALKTSIRGSVLALSGEAYHVGREPITRGSETDLNLRVVEFDQGFSSVDTGEEITDHHCPTQHLAVAPASGKVRLLNFGYADLLLRGKGVSIQF